MRRVVITGVGIISPIGRGARATQQALEACRTGIRLIEQFSRQGFPVQSAGEVPDGDVPRDAGRMEALAQLALAEALSHSGLGCEPDPRRAFSWSCGKPTVDLQRLAAELPLHPGLTAGVAAEIGLITPGPEAATRRLADRAGAGGEVFCGYTACASGNDALGLGKRLIERGQAEVVIAGASDAQVHPLSLIEFELLDALSHDPPDCACRPFDRKRAGFVVGEGAAALVLEDEASARRRGAPLLAALTGYGSSLDSYGLTKCDPEGRGAAQAMLAALGDAGMSPEEVDYINAHGTGTVLNDRAEAAGIHRVWGAHSKAVPVSSTKPYTGHLIASASAVEAVIAVLALCHQVLPPTLHYENFDPECDLAIIAGAPRAARVRAALSNGFGFGGQNSAIVVEAV